MEKELIRYMKRDNNYTAIHIIGAVLVIIGHMYILLGYPSPPSIV